MGNISWITWFVLMVYSLGVIDSAPVHIPSYVNKTVYNMSDPNNMLGTIMNTHCKLRPVDPSVHALVTDILTRQAKLIDYDLVIVGNYTTNPLLVNQTWTYKSNMWARVGSSHGQTILNLAFNYGILSLMTLTFGLEKLQIELEESPAGCLGKMSEEKKMQSVLDILMRDFEPEGDVNVFEGVSSVCHQVIKEENGMAKFTDRCCFQARDGKDIVCVIDIPNYWLHILDILLAVLSLCVFLFGPATVPDWLYTAALDKLEYYVKLKEPLYKTLVVCRREIAPDISATHTIDLRNRKDFQKCRRILGEVPADTVIPIKVSQFDINVTYRKLLLENKVPVGIISSLSRAIFLCKIKELEPFEACCNANICGPCPISDKPWKSFCSFFGRVLLVLFLPMPFYIRLAVYYMFENPEITQRLEAASKLDLNVYYNYRLMQYLTPTHPMYLSVYVMYFTAGITMAYFSGKDSRTHFQQGIMDAFKDMKNLSMLNALGMVVVNCLWPFKTFGIFGIFVGILSWPFLMPMSIVACVIYCIPLVFLTIRILYHTFKHSPEEGDLNQSLGHMHADRLIKKLGSKSNLKKAKEGLCYSSIRIQRFVVNAILTTTALFTLYSMMVMVAEVTGFLAEVMCFTMMGLIVNAAKVLKYGSLLFLVVIYSYDCYNNVNMKYLKLNKALFSEVRNRLGRDIEEFTQLPEDLQENRGFKACEASQQAEYESIDDISNAMPYHWDINDMILFIDKHDTPRIPKKLFDEVCAINVAGSPGPVYKSLLEATGKFMVIILFLVFVFIVVMSFGDSYKISSTNQMMATMAGGFMPFIFSNLLKPAAPDVETNLLSFRSKVEEIVKNFWQPWPMCDFIFDIEKEPEEEESEEEVEEEEEETFDDAESEAHTEVTVLTDKTGKTDHTEKSHKSEKSDKSESDKSKKDKHKDKDKDKKGDKKDKDKKDKPNGLATFMKVSKIDSRLVKQQVEEHDSLFIPAEKLSGKVDILIYMSESDQEWQLEWSSVTDLDKSEYNGGLGTHIV